MNVSILTVFSDLYDSYLNTSLVRKAQEKNLITVDVASFFSFVSPKERIDTPTFGHGSGMVIRPDVVEKAINLAETKHGKAFKIFFSPQGKKLNQTVLADLAKKAQSIGHLMLVPARYEGMDARVEEEYADELISVGDFVLMAGDLPAMMLLEGLLRLVPGVVGKQESIEKESFSGPFVDFPVYGEPVVWHEKQVPDIVRSGNHGEVDKWRAEQAVKKTVKHHFEWLRSYPLTDSQRDEAKKQMPNHYVALAHGQVLIGNEKTLGTTSVTSIDIHDIARSSKTYGIEHFFIVTPLVDQQRIVKTMLDFWQTGVGIDYNPSRHEAVNLVSIVDMVTDAVNQIEQKEGKKPIVVATSAVLHERNSISYFDQDKVWAHDRPVLFVFGTGRGLAPELLDSADYILIPVRGFACFNHLSVRSAVAIVLDRWLGINEKTHVRNVQQ